MRVLGLDQSYSGFGYSSHVDDGEETWKKAFPLAKFEGEADRLMAIYSWLLDDVLIAEDYDLVALEGYSFASKFNREQMGELGGIVRLSLAAVDQRYIVIPPTTLKKFVTGSGNSPKNVMLQQVYKRWGEEFADDNMADSFAAGKFGRAYLGNDHGLTKAQQEVVEKFKKDQAKTKR